MKHYLLKIVFVLLGLSFIQPSFAQLRVYAPKKVEIQGSFLVQPKSGSRHSNAQLDALEQKAMLRASSRYKARAISAYLVKQDGSIYTFKVKMRSQGRIFSKLIKLQSK